MKGEEIKNIKIGSRIKILDDGGLFPDFDEFFIVNPLQKYIARYKNASNFNNNTEATVIYIGKHHIYKDGYNHLLVVETDKNNIYLIENNNKYIELVDNAKQKKNKDIGKLFYQDEFMGNIGEYAFNYKGLNYHIGDIVIMDKNINIIVKDEQGCFIMGYGHGALDKKINEYLNGLKRSYKDLKNGEIINNIRVCLNKEDTDVLKVDLHRYESLIYGKILYQNTDILKRENTNFTANNGFRIGTYICPSLLKNFLYIKGFSEIQDNEPFKCSYNDIQEAEEYFNKIQQAVKELNEKYSKPQKKEIHKESYDMTLHGYYVHVNIRGRRTTVTLKDDDIKGSVYCNKNDTYHRQIGIEEAYDKAIRKRYEKMYSLSIEELIKKHSEIGQRISSPKLNLKKNNTIKINNKSYIIKDVQCCNEITGEYYLLLNKIEDK